MRILVVSDIHAVSSEILKFNSDGSSSNKAGYSGSVGSNFKIESRTTIKNPLLAIEECLKEQVGHIDVLLCLGDLAHQAKKLPLLQVWHDIHSLANNLGIKNVYGITGNHDLYSRAGSLDEATDLVEFLKSIEPKFPSNSPNENTEYYANGVTKFEHGNFLFVLIDTCRLHGIGDDAAAVKKILGIGHISTNMIEIISKNINESDCENVVIAMHHHPKKINLPADDIEDRIKNGDLLLQALADSQKKIFLLHGHKHLACVEKINLSGGSIIRFSASSLAALPYAGEFRYASNQFHLVEFQDIANNTSSGIIHSWDWEDPNWKPSTRPHMPKEVPFGKDTNYKEIAKNIDDITFTTDLKGTELTDRIPNIAGLTQDEIFIVNKLIKDTNINLIWLKAGAALIKEVER